MRSDHLLLQWLSIDQALENLSSITKESILEDDLISLCEEGKCDAFYRAEGVRGGTQVASLEEKPQEVYGAGYQKILNVEVLRGSVQTQSVLLRMVGPVLSNEPDDFEEVIRLWEAVVADSRRKIRFKTTDVQALANAIVGGSGEDALEARGKRSVGMLIAVLARMEPLDISRPYKAAGVIGKAAATLKLPVPSPETIVKYLEYAAPTYCVKEYGITASKLEAERGRKNRPDYATQKLTQETKAFYEDIGVWLNT